jgi:hypothetical protein
LFNNTDITKSQNELIAIKTNSSRHNLHTKSEPNSEKKTIKFKSEEKYKTITVCPTEENFTRKKSLRKHLSNIAPAIKKKDTFSLSNTANNLKEKLKKLYQKGELKPRSYSANKKELLQSTLQLSASKKGSLKDETSALSKSQNNFGKRIIDDKRISLDNSLGRIKEELPEAPNGGGYNFDRGLSRDDKTAFKDNSQKYDILNKTKKLFNNNYTKYLNMNSSAALNKGTTIIINNNYNVNNYVMKQYVYPEPYRGQDSTTNKLYNKYLGKDETTQKIDNQVYNKKSYKYSNDNIYDLSKKVDYLPYEQPRVTGKNLSSYNSRTNLQSSMSSSVSTKFEGYGSIYKKYNKKPTNNLY